MRARVRAITARRSVLMLLVGRDLKIKYERSVLGYVWSVLEPLSLACVYWFVFGKIMQRGGEDYLVYLLAGLLPWLWAASTINSSTSALTGQTQLVKTTSVPREIWVLRVVGSRWIEFLLSLPVLVLFAVIHRRAPSPGNLVLLPVAMLLQMILLTGLGLFLASVSAIFNDMKNIVRIVLRMLFYFSPILYGFVDVKEQAGDTIATLYGLNPFVGLIELYRSVWFPGGLTAADWVAVLVPCVTVSLALLALGWSTFVRLERDVLKEL